MQKNNTGYPNLKEIEQMVWRQLQVTFRIVMKKVLEEIDNQISTERDKKRYRLVEKRKISMDSLFGEIEVNQYDYRDREKGETVYLLDRYLVFERAGDSVRSCRKQP